MSGVNTDEASKTTPPTEPPDYYLYSPWIPFNKDTLKFYLAAVQFYESLLEANVKTLNEDENLKAILGDEEVDSYPIGKELKRVKQLRHWLENRLETDAWSYDLEITHGTVRLIKSVSLLYLEHVRSKRQEIASRPTTSKSLLEAVDQQLGRFEEKTQIGVFRAATPYPLIVDQLPQSRDETGSQESAPVRDFRPRPVILESIEIRDPQLRSRCLDLLAQFQEDGQLDRLDTVVTEATRILEDRLRSLSGAPTDAVGVDLARLAFAHPNALLIVSEIASEQEAAHLLYRGLFGFVRNSSHHRLLGTLQPERVLQVVGMIDYLISVAEAARVIKPKDGKNAQASPGKKT
jgi:hypothetical protein